MSNHSLTQALEQAWKSERQLGEAFFLIADRAGDLYDLQCRCVLFGHWSLGHVINLDEFLVKHNCMPASGRPAAAHAAPLRRCSEDLRHDLAELLPLAQQTRSAWLHLAEVAQAINDVDLNVLIARCAAEIDRQINWLTSQIMSITPSGPIRRNTPAN